MYWIVMATEFVLSGEFGGAGMECFGFGVLGLEVVGERKRVVAAKWDVGKGGRVARKDGYAW
ncbi:hypothetical protein ACLOJK_035196, partial [Asimina triloba]